MKNLFKIIIALFIFTSCVSELTLSKKGFNKAMDIGVKRGYIDTVSTKDSSYVPIGKKDEVEKQDDKKIDDKVKAYYGDTLYRDTCYDKKGNYAGTPVNIKKEKKKLKETLKETTVEVRSNCLYEPIFYSNDDLVLEVIQDSLQGFKIKYEIKKYNITKQDERTWWKVQLSNWYWYLIVAVLVIIIIKK